MFNPDYIRPFGPAGCHMTCHHNHLVRHGEFRWASASTLSDSPPWCWNNTFYHFKSMATYTKKKKLHIAGVAHVFSAENWGPEPEKFWTPRLMICIWNVQREEQLNQYLKKQSSWQPWTKPKVVVLPTVFVSKVTSLERYILQYTSIRMRRYTTCKWAKSWPLGKCKHACSIWYGISQGLLSVLSPALDKL